jgi:hypothetical protein
MQLAPLWLGSQADGPLQTCKTNGRAQALAALGHTGEAADICATALFDHVSRRLSAWPVRQYRRPGEAVVHLEHRPNHQPPLSGRDFGCTRSQRCLNREATLERRQVRGSNPDPHFRPCGPKTQREFLGVFHSDGWRGNDRSSWRFVAEGLRLIPPVQVRRAILVMSPLGRWSSGDTVAAGHVCDLARLANDRFKAINLGDQIPGLGRLPAYTNGGCPAPRFMKLDRQKPGTRHRLITLHSSRRDLEPSVRQELIGYVGFAASISAAPPAAVGRVPVLAMRRWAAAMWGTPDFAASMTAM